jgi:CheY-like chemotaxis protein/helix-turn-helix protein
MLADFTADVALSDRHEEPRQARVVLKTDRLAFVTDDAKRSIATSDVFDIARDISSQVTGESTETVTIAFNVGEARATASVRREAEILFQFQQALFKALLDGTSTVVTHAVGGEQKLPSTKLALSVTSSRILLSKEGADPTLAIPREQLTDFRTGEESLGGDRQPVVTLYWVDDGHPVKTTLCLPTPRLFNLFGRYVQSTIRLDSGTEDDRQASVEVLLVDDDPHDLEMGELFLKRQSDRFSLTCATSAAGGLDTLAENDGIDCVVSDYEMPGTDGIEFLQQVRQRYPDLPFILFTGQGNEEIAKRAILDDVTDYVEKDVGIDQYALLAERVWKAVS